MVVDCRVELRSIVTIARRSDQPILCPMVKVPTIRSMSLNACLNDVVADRLMHALNVASDEHLHDESPMVHRIYSVKEKTILLFKRKKILQAIFKFELKKRKSK